MNCIPLPGADGIHDTKTMKIFADFFVFAERAGASQKKRNTCFCKAQLLLLLPLARQQIAACPNQTAAPHIQALVHLIFSNQP